jgi:hypothetical protein
MTHEISCFNQTNKYILDAWNQQQVASMWSLPWQTMTRTWNVARKLEKNAFFVRQCNQKSFNLNSRYHKWKMIDSVKSQTWGSDNRKFKTWGRKKIKSVSLNQKIPKRNYYKATNNHTRIQAHKSQWNSVPIFTLQCLKQSSENQIIPKKHSSFLYIIQ